jgi:hypothetical protein
MTARQLMEVALRVLGVWFVVHAVISGAQAIASMNLILPATGFSLSAYLIAVEAVAAVQLGLGLVLVFGGPRIASHFYRDEPVANHVPSRIGPGDLYHVASYLLGVYFLVQGLEACAAIAFRLLSGKVPSNLRAYPEMAAIISTVSGLLLIFGARRIAEMLSLLRHDPDSLPRQQFSLKLLLGITFAIAMVLGLYRIAATW